MKVTYYLEVVSSWCFWAEPAWEELKTRYGSVAEFQWKLALMDASGWPKSREESEWFYRRSGTIMRSPFMLNAAWFDPALIEHQAPNLIAEAAKDFGVTNDTVRLAIARAALHEGRRVGQWEEAAAVAAAASQIDSGTLLQRARSPEIEARARATTTEFHALQVKQRPTFVLENEIGDRAVFSGLANVSPLIAAMDAMLQDAAAYRSYAAHHGALKR